MSGPIINKVANSNLVTINLEDFYAEGVRYFFDIKSLLSKTFVLREKEFRKLIKEYDWSKHSDQYIAIGSSVDAIIPVWAYMLLSKSLSPFAKKVIKGDLKSLEILLFEEQLKQLDENRFLDKRVIIKGCGAKPVPEHAYVLITNKLTGIAKRIMYGEACSTVPIYKKK